MLVHRRVTPSIMFTSTHLYTWVERDTARVKGLAQEHNTMSLVRARSRTARSRDERTNHEARTLKASHNYLLTGTVFHKSHAESCLTMNIRELGIQSAKICDKQTLYYPPAWKWLSGTSFLWLFELFPSQLSCHTTRQSKVGNPRTSYK